jgi:hypothetical protein
MKNHVDPVKTKNIWIYKIDLKLNCHNFKIHKMTARNTNATIIIPVAVHFQVDSNSPDHVYGK